MRSYCMVSETSFKRKTWKTYFEDFSHLALLRKGAVVFYGQDDGHVRIDKGSPVNCLHHILEDHGRDQVKYVTIKLFINTSTNEIY